MSPHYLRKGGLLLVASILLFVGPTIPGASLRSAEAFTPPLVTGTVSSGVLLQGVRVEVWNLSQTLYGYAFTDQYGRYTIDTLTHEVYTVSFSLAGYAPATAQGDLTSTSSVTVDASLMQLGTVSGAVSPAVAHVLVEATRAGGGGLYSAQTDMSGVFSIIGVPADTYTVVAYGFDAGYSTAAITEQSVANGQTTNVGTITLPSTGLGTVAGTVSFDYTYGTGTPTNNANEPAENFLVRAVKNGIVYGYDHVTSGGSYSIPRLPPGTTYEIGDNGVYFTAGEDDIHDPGRELIGQVKTGVSVTADTTTTTNLVLARGGSFLVRARDSSGQPVEGASITLTDSSQNSVGIGDPEYMGKAYYCSIPLVAGSYTVTVAKSGYYSESQTFTITSGRRRIVRITLTEE